VVLILYARSAKRTRLYAYALLVSLLAFLLAKVNSHNISNIQIDRTEQLEEMHRKQAEAREAEEKAKEEEEKAAERKRAAVRFVEETEEEAKDRAGKGPKEGEPHEKEAKDEAKEEARGDNEKAKEERRLAYREHGKQERAEGKKRKLEEIQEVVETKEEVSVRMMPEADVIAADRFDRVNLFFARLTPWLALVLVCLDYLSRFNKTFGHYFPLPIAGRVVDSLFPKTHSVHLMSPPTGKDTLKRYLEDAVRKGENFIYLGPTDLWEEPQLYRIWLRRRKLWPLTKLTYGSVDALDDSDFIFDSAWFRRYCFVVTDDEAAKKLVSDLLEYLRMRRIPRAAAWTTVQVVWRFEEPLANETIEELLFLSKETNFKLVVASGDPPPEDIAASFEERLDLASVAPTAPAAEAATS
jgi:hypothetical protein